MSEHIPVIDGRAGFFAAVGWGFEQAIAQGARRIVCCDDRFADWPWEDEALLQQLTEWVKLPQRRLLLLARTYEDMPRRHPRFTAWRRTWDHAIEAWVAGEEMAAGLPTLLLSDGSVSVHLIDPLRWRGRAELDERRARQWREEVDAVLQRSERGFAVNILGL